MTIFIIHDEIITRAKVAFAAHAPLMSHRIHWRALTRTKGEAVRRPKRRDHLRIDDSFWVWLDTPGTPMHVAALAIFESESEAANVVVERVLTSFRQRTDLDPRFRLVIRMRRFPLRARREQATDVDLDYHLRHHRLSGSEGEHALEQLVSRLQSIRLDPTRPMWEVHLIDGLPGNRFAVYLKAHHSLVNGVDALRLLSRSLASDPDSSPPTPVWTIGRPLPRLTPADADTADSPRSSRAKTIHAASKAAAKLWFAGLRSTPLVSPFAATSSRFNIAIGPQRHVCTASADLSIIKAIAKASGTSLNDVVLAACATALRRYLLDIGALPVKPLIAGCPVSIEAPAGASDSSIGILFADLATDDSDPSARLARISRSTQTAKEHQAELPHPALIPYAILAMAPHTLRQLVPGAAHLPPMFNLIISNVPGPPQPLYLAGAQMTELYPVSLLFKGEALNITAVSYAGRLQLGITAYAVALPHLRCLAQYFEASVEEMRRHYLAPLPDLTMPA
ncbi:wax ester/triacylglycerol synthase family O-acyltransferase [Nocardia sp. NPDC057663]|uniref:wax ester/triacylglycerol synthase family O-acyltransferase n=1 Tax=Nocardia sp. NPDC057663 TaxID=3346201 RepID=UPI00366C697B